MNLFFHLVFFPHFIYNFYSSFRPKKTVARLLQQRKKTSLSVSIIKRDRTGWLLYSQVDMPVSALAKSTNLSTTASAVVASCVSKRAQDPASSVETLYVRPLNSQIPIFSIHFLFMRVVFSFFFSWIQVCTREEHEILQRDSNKSQKLRKKLMGGESQNESKLLNVIIIMMVDAMNLVLFCWQTLEKEIISHTRRP